MSVMISNLLPTVVTRLDATEAKRIWDFIAKFMDNPAHPGLSLERLSKARDPNLWSARISKDLRAILHKGGEAWTILYADHHDAAYDWASTRRVERHVATGALQIVEAPETVALPVRVAPRAANGLFDSHGDAYLVSLGLPPDWLPTLRKVSDEDTFLEHVLPKLPEEVIERLMALLAGEFVTPPAPLPPERPSFESEDTRRRFFVLQGDEDLARMLEAPLETWLVFLHPSQRKLATGSFNGPLKVTGAAGTGKTVVALHRARHLAQQGQRVLVTDLRDDAVPHARAQPLPALRGRRALAHHRRYGPQSGDGRAPRRRGDRATPTRRRDRGVDPRSLHG